MSTMDTSPTEKMDSCTLHCKEMGECFLVTINTSIGQAALANELYAQSAIETITQGGSVDSFEVSSLEKRGEVIVALREVAEKACAINAIQDQ